MFYKICWISIPQESCLPDFELFSPFEIFGSKIIACPVKVYGNKSFNSVQINSTSISSFFPFILCICLLCRSPNTLILSRSGLMGICDLSMPLRIKMHKGILAVGPCETPTTTIARSSRNPALEWWCVPETASCLMGQSCNFDLLFVIRLDKSNKVRIRWWGKWATQQPSL